MLQKLLSGMIMASSGGELLSWHDYIIRRRLFHLFLTVEE